MEMSKSPTDDANAPLKCRPLAAELWAMVFKHVDDFTLWIHCRRVSKMLRAEAEREFAQHRLEKFDLRWECEWEDDKVDTAERYHVQCWALFDDRTSISEGNLEAQLSIGYFDIDYEPWDQVIPDASLPDLDDDNENARHLLLDGWGHHWVEPVALEMIKSQDTDYAKVGRMVHRSHRMTSFGRYINNVGIPEIQINAASRTICFNWIKLLNSLFGEEARFQHKAQRAYENGQTSINLANDNWCSLAIAEIEDLNTGINKMEFLTWMHREGAYSMWHECFIQCLQQAHAKIGRRMDLNNYPLGVDYTGYGKERLENKSDRSFSKHLLFDVEAFLETYQAPSSPGIKLVEEERTDAASEWERNRHRSIMAYLGGSGWCVAPM